MTTETTSDDQLADMRFLSMKQVTELTGYTPQHIYRLMAAGGFPQRVRIGANRIGFRKREVKQWFDERPVIDSRGKDDDEDS